MKNNWLKAFGWGLAIWAILFVIGSIFILFQLPDIWFSIIMLIAGLVVVWYIASKVFTFKDIGEAFATGLIWVVVVAVLDYLVLVLGFNGGDLSVYTWNLWVGYGIVLLLPAALALVKKK